MTLQQKKRLVMTCVQWVFVDVWIWEVVGGSLCRRLLLTANEAQAQGLVDAGGSNSLLDDELEGE